MLYFSSLLQANPAYRGAAIRLFAALDAHGVRYGLLDNTRDIWLRDFMPVRRGDGKFISFRYEPSYLKGCPGQRTDFGRDIRRQFRIFDAGFGYVIHSAINLDGGNVVFSPAKGKAIVSDRVFTENPVGEQNALIRELEKLLEAQVIIVPSLPGDLTGHADGMVRFVDENTVIGNATSYQNGLEQRVRAVLEREGLSVIDFPYCESSGISAAGCYLNYLETDKYIFLPVFGIELDEPAMKEAKRIFPKTIVPVQINEVAADGGCLNCISWELNVQDAADENIPLVPCPVCGNEVGALYGICPRCGWEYDGVIEDAGFSGANNMTLAEYKKTVAPAVWKGDSELSTAWMIRNDGTAFPCVCHTYGNWDVQVVEETLAAAQWLYEHTAKSAVRELCMELIYVWAKQFSMADFSIVETIDQIIDSRPYRFLSKEFISAHAGELRAPVFEQSLESLNEDLNLELNQEFLRARYGGLYDTGPASREMFFRISSTAFNWHPVIRDFVRKAEFPIEFITIVRDAEGAGGKNRPYRRLNGRGIYRALPLMDFLAEPDDLSAESKGLVRIAPAEAVRKRILEGLSAGRSLRELRGLPMNWERLKQFVRRCSWKELGLTADEDSAICGRSATGVSSGANRAL